jgi:hypothetical protein
MFPDPSGNWVYTFDDTTNTVTIISASNGAVSSTQTLDFNFPTTIVTNSFSRIYATSNDFTSLVWYTVNPTGTLALGGTVTTNLQNPTVVGLDGVNNVLVYTSNPPTLTAFDDTGTQQYTTPLPGIPTGQTVLGLGYNWQVTGDIGEAISYAISNQSFQSSVKFTVSLDDLAKNDELDQLLILINQNTVSITQVQNVSGSKVLYQSPNTLVGIYAKSGSNLSAPNVPIYYFSTLLDAINTAFANAHSQLKTSPSQIPSVSLNYQTSLATLSGVSDYTGTGNGILFNNGLLRILKFETIPDTIDVGFNLLTVPTGAETLLQNDLSLYLFNQLDSIQYVSNTIYVFGSYFANNNTNNVITTVQVPTNTPGYTNNVGQTLYYEPTFLRPYMLASDNALQRIQLAVYYVYNDGSAYILPVAPKTNWNGTLIFMKRF